VRRVRRQSEQRRALAQWIRDAPRSCARPRTGARPAAGATPIHDTTAADSVRSSLAVGLARRFVRSGSDYYYQGSKWRKIVPVWFSPLSPSLPFFSRPFPFLPLCPSLAFFLRCLPLEVKKCKDSPDSITERKVSELMPVLDGQPAGDVSHKPGGRLPLLSARPAVTLETLKRAAT